MKTQNRYEFKDDYVIGYTNRYNNEFYFDIEDYDIVKDYNLRLSSDKDVIDHTTLDKQISMHQLIMGDGIYIHKNGQKNDNRKNNLINRRGYANDGYTILNGYLSIYIPEHPRAFDNGCVYEHILIAEKILGRDLKPEECVHHIDLDRKNNKEENLMVFATNADHIAFHGGGDAVLQKDGTYKTINKYCLSYGYQNQTILEDNKISVLVKKRRVIKEICPVCKINYKRIESSTCVECYRKQQAKNIPPKEILESLIYNTPFTQIGRMYGVDGNAVKKWCKKYNLPFRKKDMKITQLNENDLGINQENSLNVS